MSFRPLEGFRRAMLSALTLGMLAGCDDPAQLAQDITDAQGECTQDSLRVSSEACIGMFQKYAEMATEAMHTYIGGLKAMDAALQRLPPPNFDTTGIGRAFTYGRDSVAADSGSFTGYGTLPPATSGYSAPGDKETAADPTFDRAQAPGEWPRGYTGPGAASGAPLIEETPTEARIRASRPPAARPGVLLPPGERLNRPWLEPEEDAAAGPRGSNLPTDPRWEEDVQEPRPRDKLGGY